MKWVLIRHGSTQGNLERRYIGCRTDQPLCPQGTEELKGRAYPPVQRVFVSPMQRCLQTAALIYPGLAPEVVPDFRECDFGEFENLRFEQLAGRADYQAWVESGGRTPFPGGESREDFCARCLKAFESLMAMNLQEDCALIAHGGTIMAILEKYARPGGDYFDFQAKNGEGFILFPQGRWEPLFPRK